MLLSAEHLSINFGSRQLLEDVNFYLNEGDKVGVIGINGTGKSTFLKVLAGKLEADAGTISRNPNVQVSLLEQNPPMEDDATVLEQVFLHFPKEFRELNEYEAKSMLNKLGLPDYEQKVGTLSGGQRKRVALAAALIHPADVLVLDEPTNHLDAEMTAWLEDWLRRFKGGLVMVTHDRYFLERVVNHITELSRGKLYHYEANYSKYLELKAQRAEMAEASERKRQSILRTEREWIMRGCRARTTKSKDRIERYEALKNQEAPETDDTVQLAAASSRLGKKLIELHDVSKSYEGRTVIRDFSYNLLRNDRIGIVGHNGAGKSTLLRLFAGELSPDSGTVDIGTTVKIGHFSQEGRELDLNQRVYDFIHDIVGQVQGVTIFGSPAADAVQVAGAGRVEEDGPGNIAVIFRLGGVARTQAVKSSFKAQVHDGRLDDMRVQGIQSRIEEAEPFAPFIDESACIVKGFLFKEVAKQMLHDIR